MPPPGTISNLTLAASAAVTTQGSSAAIDATGWGSLTAMCSITTGTPTAASVTTFRVWLQGRLNEGGVWNDLVLLNATKSFAGANLALAAGVTTVNSTSLAAEATGQSSVVNFIGRLNCPPPQVRVAWNLVAASGAPFVTFGVEGVLSQINAP
jgi:hypothetical protein